jgi:hypothetical protein
MPHQPDDLDTPKRHRELPKGVTGWIVAAIGALGVSGAALVPVVIDFVHSVHAIRQQAQNASQNAQAATHSAEIAQKQAEAAVATHATDAERNHLLIVSDPNACLWGQSFATEASCVNAAKLIASIRANANAVCVGR